MKKFTVSLIYISICLWAGGLLWSATLMAQTVPTFYYNTFSYNNLFSNSQMFTNNQPAYNNAVYNSWPFSSSLNNTGNAWWSSAFTNNQFPSFSPFKFPSSSSYFPSTNKASYFTTGPSSFTSPFSFGHQSSWANSFSRSSQSSPWYQQAATFSPWASFLSPFSSLGFPLMAQSQQAGKLDCKITTNRSAYQSKDTVKITFTVTNPGTKPVTLNFTSGKQFDVIVKNNSGKKIWQMSSHKFYTLALSSLKLEAGQSHEFQAEWNQKDDGGLPVQLGSYTIEAFLTTTDQNYTASTCITIKESLPRFSSCAKLREKLSEMASGAKYGGYYAYGGIALDTIRAPMATAPEANTNFSGEKAAEDYSTTNIQVAGVDESDRIKNDGKYIYLIKGKSIRIIKAYPVDELLELPKIDFTGSTFTPEQLYVDEDRLIVIGHDYAQPNQESGLKIMAPTIWAGPYYLPSSSATRVIIYDISDRSQAKEERNLKFEADYLQSRRVDHTLYLIMNQYPQYIPVETDKDEEQIDTEEMIPKYADSAQSSIDEPLCDCQQIAYFPGSEESRYLIVAAIPISDPEKEIGKEVVLGSSQNIYSSKNNLYVAHTSYGDGDRYSQNTTVYKFSLDGEQIQYEGKAEVQGTIINQFSMDEYDNHFRIATTAGQTWDEKNPSSNNLYVLDADLKQVGSIENIAPGESIKSVRFMGDKAYVVTFLQIDPLFVISLKDPTEPKILGQLKIPGYSEYLHPYDENHLIGFGREVDASIDADKIHSAHAVYYTAVLGMKISLFDVTDVEHPVELHKEVIGYRNTQSELLQDHRALLFSKDKNLMAFPITVTQKVVGSESNDYEYTFQGAYFYHIDLTNGFEREAAITHYDSDEEFKKSGYYFYGGEDNIRRIIYIADHFYTVSDSKIKAIDMKTYNEDKTLVLEKDEKNEERSPLPDDTMILFKQE